MISPCVSCNGEGLLYKSLQEFKAHLRAIAWGRSFRSLLETYHAWKNNEQHTICPACNGKGEYQS